MSHTHLLAFPFSASESIGWATGRASDLQKVGYWFVGGDDLTGALQFLYLQLSPPLPTSLASLKPANPGSLAKMAVKTETDMALSLCFNGHFPDEPELTSVY